MGKFEKILVKKLSAQAKAAFAEQKAFFSKPANLIALGIAGVALLNAHLKKIKAKAGVTTNPEEDEDMPALLRFLKNNPTTETIISYSLNNLDEDFLSFIVLNCNKGTPPQIEVTPDNYQKDLSDLSDIDTNTSAQNRFVQLNNSINVKYDTAEKKGQLWLMYGFMLIYIIQLTKDLIKNAEFPSKYRLKYIQKLIRTTYGLMKAQGLDLWEDFKEQLQMLKQIDNLLVALSLATATYIKNRQLLQKRSRESLKEISAEQACGVDLPEPLTGDVSTSTLTLPISAAGISCPLSLDNVVTPNQPYELKAQNFTCVIPLPEQIYADAEEDAPLAVKAIIYNIRSKEKLIASVPIDTYVDVKKPVGTLFETPVFAPVEGYVDYIEPNRIIIRDIQDTSDDYLNSQISLLSEKYAKLNDIKLFIDNYFIPSLYPVMLTISTMDDASTKSTKNIVEEIAPQFQGIHKKYVAFKKDYDKNIQDITGEANVKKHSENETLDVLQKNLETLQELYYKNLRTLKVKADNVSKITKSKSAEYTLIEYYLYDLSESLNAIQNPNEVEKPYIKEINDIIIKRYFLDKFKLSDVEKKINKLIKDLEKGISIGNWFDKMLDHYKAAKGDKISSTKDWLQDIANKNNKMDPIEKSALVNKIMYLFNFYLKIKNLDKTYVPIKSTSKDETIKEGLFIDKYFGDLWKEYDQIAIDIVNITKIIDGLSLFTTYSIVDYNGEPHRLYTICDEPTCKLPDDMALVPGSSYSDKRYWLKYCAFATLASVTNPVTGWSTGIPPPFGPIPLPVIYVPIKPIQTKYGFVVIGLTICGLYIFPWTLFANLSSSFNIPIGDPVKALKNEVKAMQKLLTTNLKNLRKEALKPYLDKTKRELEAATTEIERTQEVIRLQKEAKPVKPTNATEKEKLDYRLAYVKWVETSAVLKESLLTLKTQRWVLQKKHRIVFEAYSMGKPVKGSTDALEKQEQFINDQFAKLDVLVDKIDNIIAPLPITMQPDSANFGITLKNPKPLTEIASDLDQTVNFTALNKLLEPFKLKNADLMSTNYGAKLSNSVLNYKKYRNILSAANLTLIEKDPFPPYQNLKLKNLPWLSFLYKDFVTTGAKQYGFPGFPPIPI